MPPQPTFQEDPSGGAGIPIHGEGTVARGDVGGTDVERPAIELRSEQHLVTGRPAEAQESGRAIRVLFGAAVAVPAQLARPHPEADPEAFAHLGALGGKVGEGEQQHREGREDV